MNRENIFHSESGTINYSDIFRDAIKFFLYRFSSVLIYVPLFEWWFLFVLSAMGFRPQLPLCRLSDFPRVHFVHPRLLMFCPSDNNFFVLNLNNQKITLHCFKLEEFHIINHGFHPWYLKSKIMPLGEWNFFIKPP